MIIRSGTLIGAGSFCKEDNMIAYRAMQKSGAPEGDYTITVVYGNQHYIQNGSCAQMFANNATFNDDVIIGNNVNTCYEMFFNCSNFNRNIQIPDTVDNCLSMFRGCSNLNQNIKLPNNIKYIGQTFFNCSNLNQNIRLPESVVTMSAAFQGCSKLNQNIKIPQGVTDITFAFSGTNVNQNIVIPNTVTSLYQTFASSAMNCDITIPESVLYCTYTLVRTDFSRNIYFKGNAYRELHTDSLFQQANTAKRKNLFFNIALNNRFNNTVSGWTLVYHNITWQSMTNGYYNSEYNIYCYTNYPG